MPEHGHVLQGRGVCVVAKDVQLAVPRAKHLPEAQKDTETGAGRQAEHKAA